ncbi:YeiH family protein [Roseicella aerolata]|uniref:Sulfate exporter family transporter n=1 Tax=Roseicella aerolata TaxID=2883479 RepID=A0A9X1L716_9PROT|nr:putative sulfate exporter family transporter [Roseicella aerolata]MCB4821441.1 putative sulfate exporter family transporter [Roseicella aerolata]
MIQALQPSLRLLPGIALCIGIALAAHLLEAAERQAFRHPWLDTLVLAILLGAALRTGWEPGERWRPGLRFSAGPLLETAIVLLGASLDLRLVLAAGPALPLGIAAVVLLSLLASYGAGRILGLPHRMAVLVAAGNAICGNSAIAAVAPIIGAGAREVASAIAFTAVLGVGLVLGLPLLAPALGLSAQGYGMLAGMTVYAVPQVLAATAPFGSLSMQAGTLVKLLRVLMLGPLVLALSLLARRLRPPAPGEAAGRRPAGYMPWFIIGFLLLALLNALSLVPQAALAPLRLAAGLLTGIAMAALGLGVDLRALGRVGVRVTAAAAASLLVLIGLSLGAIRLLGLA